MTPEQLAAARLRERADNVDRFLADNESERDGWLSSMPVAEMRRDAEELRSTADVLDAQAEEIERLRRTLNDDLEVAHKMAIERDSLRSRLAEVEAERDEALAERAAAVMRLEGRIVKPPTIPSGSHHKQAIEPQDHDDIEKWKESYLEAAHQRETFRSRLAEVEAECLEQARLNGAGSERDARLLAKLAEVERKVAYYESALTIDDGELTALRGGGVAKAIKRTRVVDLIGKLAEVEAERDEARKCINAERAERGLRHRELNNVASRLAESQGREARLRKEIDELKAGR
jgi:hypothetical protein